MSKRYCVYVDGFNLYHRCLKNTPYRWLDLKQMFANLKFNEGTLVHIRYFTAKVQPTSWDKDVHIRQSMYLRALRTIPECSLHFGQFKKRQVQGQKLDHQKKPTNGLVTIEKYEEKGSDVNIANYMLVDGFLDRYDAAILVSNDSDLAGTLDLIKEHIKKPVGLAIPSGMPTFDLKSKAAFTRKITESILRDSQFSDTLSDSVGSFTKPKKW